MNKNLLHLLRQNISAAQLAGYVLAAFAGVSILLAGFCFSRDIRPLFSPGDEAALFSKELLVVNKQVPALSVLGVGDTYFSGNEIEELRRQPFVRSLSYFTQARFAVKAYIEASRQMVGFSTDMFFESVPDHLLGRKNPKWHWNENAPVIPIIIPQDYLSLYNFGFATTQGLPQISESVIQQLTFRIVLTGNGKRETFNGQIVDFSNDLNTILVPETFMQWANEQFGAPQTGGKVSRLLLETGNPADPKIAEFFAANPDYVINDNKGESGRLSYFLTLLIVAVMTIGTLIMLPSIGLILLSINLIIFKNQKTISDLLLIGYRRDTLAQPYCWLVVALNLFVAGLSLVTAYILRGLYLPKLAVLGISAHAVNFSTTAFFALIITFLLVAIDVFWIFRRIKNIDIPKRR